MANLQPENGFITLDRKMTKWEWYDDANTMRLFLHLLFTVNWLDGRWHGIEVKRGQRITSLSILAKELSLSIQNVRTSISKLKSTGEVTDKSHSKFRILTVTKYNQYQDSNKQTNRQPTSNQQATNNNITKKQRNKETSIYTAPPEKFILDFFNKTCGTGLVLTGKKQVQLRERLKVFTVEQIKQAIENRVGDPWYAGQNQDGKLWFKDWDSLFRNDEKIERALELRNNKKPKSIDEQNRIAEENFKKSLN